MNTPNAPVLFVRSKDISWAHEHQSEVTIGARYAPLMEYTTPLFLDSRSVALQDYPVDGERWYADTPDGDSALVTRVGGLTEWQRGRDGMRVERDSALMKLDATRAKLKEVIGHPSMSFHQVALLQDVLDTIDETSKGV